MNDSKTDGVPASEPVGWLVPILNEKPRLFDDLAEARAFCSKQNGLVYPQPLIVAPGYPYRASGVDLVDHQTLPPSTTDGKDRA